MLNFHNLQFFLVFKLINNLVRKSICRTEYLPKKDFFKNNALFFLERYDNKSRREHSDAEVKQN